MNYLRTRRKDGHFTLETPIVELIDDNGRRALVVLTAHLGTPAYFERLRRFIEAADADVFYESVRTNSTGPAHWDEPYHAFLRALRDELYEGIASLGELAFQGHHLAPAPTWRNADTDCCTLAARLRDEDVSLRRFNLALGAFRDLVARARDGDTSARDSLDCTIRWGLVAVSFSPVFGALRVLPSTRRLYRIINDWRSGLAVEIVLREATRDFVLIYGAAHGDTIVAALRAAGFHPRRRFWTPVFTT